MALYASQMILKGYKVETRLGYGSPKKAIPKIVKDYNADILVMGAHGHRMLKDIIFGTTIDTVRHNVTVPVMIVRA
jgi:manganese transport protein